MNEKQPLAYRLAWLETHRLIMFVSAQQLYSLMMDYEFQKGTVQASTQVFQCWEVFNDICIVYNFR